MTYKFNEKDHIHTLDGRPLMGVTSVLRIINKPFLIQWAVNQAIGYIKENAPVESEVYTVSPDILKKAMKAHDRIKNRAGSWGTNVHKVIENWIKLNIVPEDLDEMQQKAFDNFKEWVDENKVEFLESEKHVWSEKMWVGGICDLVIKMDGKKYIADIKTSSGIYKEAFFQMGAYALCLEDMDEHKDVEGYLVINLKKNGTIDTMMATDMDLNKRAFTSALELYRITESIL